jgi:polar amino acid transport system substrate-binding protein
MKTKTSFRRGAYLAAFILTTGTAVNAMAADVTTISAGTLTIGSDQVYAPYDYQENGMTEGFDADVMGAIAPRLGLKVNFVDTRFENLITGLQANRFDIIASALYITPARAKVVDYIPYATTGGSLMVRTDESFAPQTPDDLCGKTVANLQGAAWIPELQKVSQEKCGSNPIVIREFPTSAEADQALLALGADVVFDDAGVEKAAIAATGNRLKITSTKILFPVVMGLAVKKGNDALYSALKSAFMSLNNSPQYDAILAKYNLGSPTNAEISTALNGNN